MSVSPLQNSSNPSPVPGPSTFTVTSAFSSWNASPAADGDRLHGGRARDVDLAGGFAASAGVAGRGVVVVIAARSGDHADAEDDGKPRHTAAVLG